MKIFAMLLLLTLALIAEHFQQHVLAIFWACSAANVLPTA